MYIKIPLQGGYNEERYLRYNAQRLINLYTVFNKTSAESVGLANTPGTHLRITLESGSIIRKLFKFKDKLYVICSEYVYEIDTFEIATLLGVLDTASGYVGMASNANQVIIVDGIKGYIIESSVLSEITDVNFLSNPTDVASEDTFFIVVSPQNNQWAISASNDGKVWPALNYVDFITHISDTIVGVRSFNGLVYIFGTHSTQVWRNEGTPDFPFRQQLNMLIEYGCYSPATIAEGNDVLIWLGGTRYGVGSIMMTDGTRPVPISTRSIDYQIQSYEDISDTQAYVYRESGHTFYVLNFTAANHTWVYDIEMQEWSEREMANGSRHIGQDHEFFNNRHYLGGYNEPKLYESSINFFDDNGEDIRRTKIFQHTLDPDYHHAIVNFVEVIYVAGIDIPSNNENSSPKLYISMSKDGGNSYGNIREVNLGKLGEREKRAIIRRWGYSATFTFKLEFFCQVPIQILNVLLDIQPLGF